MFHIPPSALLFSFLFVTCHMKLTFVPCFLHPISTPVSWEKNKASTALAKPWGITLISYIDQVCCLIRKPVYDNTRVWYIWKNSSRFPKNLLLRCVLLGLRGTPNAFYFYANYSSSSCNELYQIWKLLLPVYCCLMLLYFSHYAENIFLCLSLSVQSITEIEGCLDIQIIY